MTTVACRNGIIAADRRITIGNGIVGNTAKIQFVGDFVIAWAGSCTSAERLRFALHRGWRPFSWEEDQDKHHSWVDRYASRDIDAIIVDLATGQVGHCENGVMLPMAICEYAALGSGARFARGAMEAGAGAIAAVEIGIKLDTNSGGGVDWFDAQSRRGRIDGICFRLRH